MAQLTYIEPARPAVLEQAPPRMIAALSLDTLLARALEIKGNEHAMGSRVALVHIRMYVLAAKHQQVRIKKNKAAGMKAITSGQLFADYHFYMTALIAVYRFARHLKQTARMRRVSKTFNRYDVVLRRYPGYRDHLEHLEQRLPGGKPKTKLRDPRYLFEVSNDSIRLGGDLIDCGPTAQAMLEGFSEELQRAALYDACETVAKSDWQFLHWELWQTAQHVGARAFMEAIGPPYPTTERRSRDRRS